MTRFVAIIPAGGAGTRLWPLSRRSLPKFLLDLTGTGSTLIEQTAKRLGMADEIMVVTGRAHAENVARQRFIDAGSIVVEPSGRDSMPAIGLAAAIVEHRHGPDTIVGSFAADHVIDDTAGFAQSVRKGLALAENGYLATIGITPTRPDTGFGYIETAGPAPVDGTLVAASFTEKPDAETASGYLQSGRYLWNAGMFLATAGNLLDWLATYKPDLAAGLRDVARRWDPENEECVATWESLEACVIDRAIAEPLADRGRVAVVPAQFDWSDIGGYAALDERRASRVGAAPHGSEQPVVTVDSPGAMVFTSDRPVVVHGIEDAVVVDAGDVVYVARKDAAGLSGIVSSLTERGMGDLR